MFNPFPAYSRMAEAAFAFARTSGRIAEMLDASQQVISRRTAMIGDALRSPTNGNYAELGRMVPEKMIAFAQAGSAVATHWWDLQASFVAEASHWGAVALKGRAPTLAEMSTHAARTSGFALGTLERLGGAADKSLDPIHATATANAKRLRRGKI